MGVVRAKVQMQDHGGLTPTTSLDLVMASGASAIADPIDLCLSSFAARRLPALKALYIGRR